MSVKIGRNDPCWCGSGKKYKACHQAFDERIAMIASQGHIVPTHDLIKNADQIAGIKESCKINIAVLDYIEKHIHAASGGEHYAEQRRAEMVEYQFFRGETVFSALSERRAHL